MVKKKAEEVKEPLYPNICVSIKGPPGSGKTHLAYTFPPPILVYNFDRRGNFVRGRPEFKAKDIDVKVFTPPVSDTLEPDEETVKFRNEIRNSYKKDIESGKYETVVLDPNTILWEHIHRAYKYDEGRGKLRARSYGEPNAQMSWYINYPLELGMNVVVISYMRDKYVDDKPTGEEIIDGFKRTDGFADIVIETSLNKENQVVSKLTKCGFDKELTGEVQFDTDYDELMSLIFAEDE